MSDIAKVFRSGRFQAIRLPEKYRMDTDEVEITREGEILILRPRKRPGWSGLLAALDTVDAERFAECFAP
ncbi:MAG: AbrB/MazE/SpoVT family DNA-binding domain-containing protein [Geminicoccaceae bacterium]|nr:AbrB/MazE/SpoVT family DNA-binding domain-containing protein [Geminicoccaceae bacterium]HRY24122.1 AbrB/MazE/SpoVT family DNA-binding domain-containing protein [Geminicoccaceae bacterium]